jgi:hypothetical protein
MVVGAGLKPAPKSLSEKSRIEVRAHSRAPLQTGDEFTALGTKLLLKNDLPDV